MTREHKLALVVGFSLVLVVGVLVSDHFSKARNAKVLTAMADQPVDVTVMPTVLPETPDMRNPASENGTPLPATLASVQEVPATAPIDAPLERPTIIDTPGTTRSRTTLASGIPGSNLIPEPLTPVVNVTRTDLSGRDPAPFRTDPPSESPQPPKSTLSLPVSTGVLNRHEVAKGDTFIRLADKYYSDRGLWKNLLTYNKGRVNGDGALRIGTTLLIPPRDVLLGMAQLPPDAKASTPGRNTEPKSDAKAADATKPQTKPAPEKISKPDPSLYVVKSGDTLGKIAERQLGSRGRWAQIRDLNKDVLDDEDTLDVGMKLKLPSR